jgi:hypothetical protein
MRRLSLPAFLGIVVVDLLILQGVGALGETSLEGFEHGHFETREQVALGLLAPVGLSVVFVYAVVAALGWRRPVLVDDRPVRRWVWVVPAVVAVAIAAAVDTATWPTRGSASWCCCWSPLCAWASARRACSAGSASSRSVSTASARAESRCGRASSSAPCT